MAMAGVFTPRELANGQTDTVVVWLPLGHNRSKRIRDGKITASCSAEPRGLAAGSEEDSWTNDQCSAVSVQRRCSGILVTNGGLEYLSAHSLRDGDHLGISSLF